MFPEVLPNYYYTPLIFNGQSYTLKLVTVSIHLSSCSFCCDFIMATIHLVAECDRYRHGAGWFHLRCLAMANYEAGHSLACMFDTSASMHCNMVEYQTCCYQADNHGHPINGHGLPPSVIRPVLYHFIQAALIETMEA